MSSFVSYMLNAALGILIVLAFAFLVVLLIKSRRLYLQLIGIFLGIFEFLMLMFLYGWSTLPH